MRDEIVFYSDRVFKLWDYTASFQQILIRSPMSPSVHTNIDVFMWGVEFLRVPSKFKGLHLGVAHDSDCGDLSPSSKGSTFTINSDGKQHLIVALGFRVYENTLEIFDPVFVMSPQEGQQAELGKLLVSSSDT